MPSDGSNRITWRLHLRSSPEAVFDELATDSGRKKFWAESSKERDGIIHLDFPDGSVLDAKIIEKKPPRKYVIEYFGGSVATFQLDSDGRGGTDLTLSATKVKFYEEEMPGWVSVLMELKAAVDFAVDLRNHDTDWTWEDGYVDN